MLCAYISVGLCTIYAHKSRYVKHVHVYVVYVRYMHMNYMLKLQTYMYIYMIYNIDDTSVGDVLDV